MAEQPGVEYKVKAAFLLNFARFVTWPTVVEQTGSFPLCIVGDDPFGEALAGIETKAVGGKQVELRFPAVNSKQLGQCRMLFISQSESQNVARILKMIAGKPVVTISDVDGFTDAGGIFEFKDQRGRLSFVINNSGAKAQGLSISSSLLNLAVDVL
ncbi:MAG: YfiR family protein [Desulfobulbus sp.]|nr:YfiR family protein [Desulfobulbus sp.]